MWTAGSLAAALCVLCAGVAHGQAAATTEVETQIEATAPIKATLMVGGKVAKVKLVGRADTKVAYQEIRTGATPTRLLPRESIEDCFIELDLKRNELDEIVVKRQWMTAASMVLGAVKPSLAYVDVPRNNIAELVLRTGDYIMRSADLDMRTAQTEAAEAAVQKKYEAAYSILKHAAQATWSSDGTIARVKSIKCLLELKKPKTAKHYFEQIDEPFPGDAAYGVYWLVKAEIETHNKDWRAAMDAAVKSLSFESKDIDTFPDALLMSARCYEELQEWYRARDVYFEVARLFSKTDWADLAIARLAFIVDQELTVEEEDRPIENVFFHFTEDINALVADLLEAHRTGGGAGDYSQFDEAEDEFGTKDLDKEDGEKKEEEFLD